MDHMSFRVASGSVSNQTCITSKNKHPHLVRYIDSGDF